MLPITVSIGAACLNPGESLPIEQILAQADKALYHVKQNGRNAIAFWPEVAERKRCGKKAPYCGGCGIFDMLLKMLDARHRTTGEHSRRIAGITEMLAEELALPAGEIETLVRGALLHDIGKIAIPEAILLKPGSLTPSERQIMRQHPRIGYDLIRHSPDLEPFADLVLSHQERFDGTGYPRRLKGKAISLGARIFAVADAYDAIRSWRPYSSVHSPAEAIEMIRRGSGTQFDPAVVAAFERCQKKVEAFMAVQP